MKTYTVTSADIEKFLKTITSDSDEWYGFERYMTGEGTIALLGFVGYSDLDKLENIALSKD